MMRIPEMIPFGSEVYFFDPVLHGDMPIIKTVVIGAFIHKNEGELYYDVISKQVPAYCVFETLAGAQQQRAAFEEYRKIKVSHMRNSDKIEG